MDINKLRVGINNGRLPVKYKGGTYTESLLDVLSGYFHLTPNEKLLFSRLINDWFSSVEKDIKKRSEGVFNSKSLKKAYEELGLSWQLGNIGFKALRKKGYIYNSEGIGFVIAPKFLVRPDENGICNYIFSFELDDEKRDGVDSKGV